MVSANTTLLAAKESNLLFNIEWPLVQQKAFVLLPLDHFTHTHTQKKPHIKEERKSQLSWRHLALSANPTVHRMDLGGFYRHWSAVQQLGHCGSKPKVKGRTAVRSTGRCKTHLPTYIIENPPTVSAQTLLPLSLSSVSFSLLLQWGRQQERRNDADRDISSLALPQLFPILLSSVRSPPLYHRTRYITPKTADPLSLCKAGTSSLICFSIVLCFGARRMLESASKTSTEPSATSCSVDAWCPQTLLKLFPLGNLRNLNNEECL